MHNLDYIYLPSLSLHQVNDRLCIISTTDIKNADVSMLQAASNVVSSYNPEYTKYL